MIRKVCVPFVIALMGMMFQMVHAKAHCTRRKIWKIGNDRHHFIPARAPENQVMCRVMNDDVVGMIPERADAEGDQQDRKSTRLNSSHGYISYAVFCLKKKT